MTITEENLRMGRYITASILAVSIGGAVAAGVFVTREPGCLFGLIAMLLPAYVANPELSKHW